MNRSKDKERYMVIGVDAGCLGIRDKRLQVGVFQVAYNLLQELAKIDKKNRYLLYSFDPIDKKLLKNFGNNMQNKVLRPKRGWMTIRLPLEFIKEKPDIFLGLSQVMPPYHPFKTLGFVHGLDLRKDFHTYGNAYQKLKQNTESLIKNADHLVVSSYFLKDSIRKTYKSKNITVLPLGVSKNFTSFGEKFRLDKPYFLFVGTLKPSKNIPRILSGFNKFLITSKKDYYLVIVGSNFWMDKQILTTIENLKLRKYVKIFKFIKNSELPKYYRGATALVSPSLYEGFGLPLLEAMSCGCPVIASNNKAEREVLGNSGYFVNPKEDREISNALTYFASNNGTRYQKRGRIQAKKFTWRSYAKGIYNLLNQENIDRL